MASTAITQLAIEKDKTGQDVVVKFANPIGGTPIISFYHRHYSVLIENGFTNPTFAATNLKHKGVYLEINGEMAGHIVFEMLDDSYKTLWITFSCVEDKFRRRGLYEIMHKHIEEYAKKQGSRKIASFVHVDNKVRQASCAKVGMTPYYYRMEKNLEE